MKTLFLALFLIGIMVSSAFAKDAYVNGYYRKDGTYVQPYVRSSPDTFKWNNYGSKSNSGSSSYGYSNPYNRDSDKDGIYNQYDIDDNNNGKLDDWEKLFK